ncbi:MAG: ATP-binding protein [Bacteroidaceae bacterium]|nr:ATP-binding protein [Bacteroidaceae bacterium]
MRSLRKIIYINSAKIRYAEVNVDGNVHFIGTQGVGKSTLLRTIMFFYNADKSHLGIKPEMKSFDDFYLPHPNSYIVYEVDHENGPFSILVYKYSGRACFRFIDAPFQKDWLIDESGEVTPDIKTIRQRVGKIQFSPIVDRYEQYRDIIYGNSSDKNFRRFHIMEAKSYSNIYRSIQNVFLNSRLEADFIKDIIINSMNDQEISIKLSYYRGQVSDFEQEYNDIRCWYNTDNKGNNVVRNQADDVVEDYRKLLYLNKKINGLCGELKHSLRQSNKKAPELEDKIGKQEEELQRQKRLLSEESSKHDKEKSDINKQIGEIDGNLKKCKEKKEQYAKLQIDSIIKKSEQEASIRLELDSTRQRLQDLTKQSDDIVSKYRKLVEAENLTLDKFRQSLLLQESVFKDSILKEKEAQLSEYASRKSSVEEDYAGKLSETQEIISDLTQQIMKVGHDIDNLRYLEPYKAELESRKQALRELEAESIRIEGEIKSLTSEISKNEAEYEKSISEKTSEFETARKEMQSEVDSLKSEIQAIDTLLANLKGSLYEWLEENAKDWKENIGKVIDEEVLYTMGLNPSKFDKGDSLYGINLDLSSLTQSVRNPEDLKDKKENLQKAIDKGVKAIEDLSIQFDNEKERLQKKYNSLLQPLREKKSIDDYELENLPSKEKKVKVEIDDFLKKSEKEREARKDDLETIRQDLSRRKQEAQSGKGKLEEDKKKQLKSVEKAYKDAISLIEDKMAKKSSEIQDEIKNRETITSENIKRLNLQENEELKGKGVDTRIVQECKAMIESYEKELTLIDGNKELIYSYRKDKAEYLDREQEFRKDVKSLNEKLGQLNEKYVNRQKGYTDRIDKISKDITEDTSKLKSTRDAISKANDFISSTTCPSEFEGVSERDSTLTPDVAVEQITGSIIEKNSKLESFKRNINVFKSHFSAKNTFSFRTNLGLDSDYFEFAANLEEFIQHNKIEDFRKRTSERYTQILNRVSSEVGDLTRHESEVAKIINDINSDFKEKNFVKAIKLIALQHKDSSDKMVVLMKHIKEFCDENQYNMGEANLFSMTNRDSVNERAVELILAFMKTLNENSSRQTLTLSDLFQLEFRVKENENDTGWTSKLSHVGSEGTDTLVKAMVNIMLINVFKTKDSKKFGDFTIHCMMDEIGKLHPQNIKGILEFANSRNIILVNSSPTTTNVSSYKYTYLLDKDAKSNTVVKTLISQR